jgi:hypothetical protein
MRLHPTFLLPLLVFALSATPRAYAQNGAMTGKFASTFEKVVDNCQDIGAELSKAKVVVSRNGKLLTVKIPSLPDMKGKIGKRGKLRAEATGASESSGIRGQYGLNGRITGNQLQAVLVAEFYKDDKPQCTQSWSVIGKRTKR